MKVLHICQMIGGLDVYVRNIITFSSSEFEFVIVRGKDDASQPVIKQGKRVREYSIRLYRQLNLVNDCMALIQTIRIILKEKPDVIHCHSAKGGFIGRWAGYLTGVRTLYTPHAFSFLCTDSKPKMHFYIWLEKSAKLKSCLLACSNSEQRLGIEVVGYRKERTRVWHHVVSDTPHVDTVIKQDINKPYICYIGRPSFQKNTFFLLDVVKEVHDRHPEVKFYLLGAGYYSPDTKELKRRIVQYGLEETFEILNWMNREEAMKYIDGSLLYLSVSRYEGFPQALIEAMSMGKAVIASDVIGNKEWIKPGENGYLLPLDISAFVEKLCLLIEKDNLREEMGKKSMALYEKCFLNDDRICVLEEIYRRQQI